MPQTLPPSGSVHGSGLPRAGINVALLHISLDDVLEAFSLPSNGTLALPELGEENLLWESSIRHPYDVSSPAKLMANNHRLDARSVRLKEDTIVGAPVFPPNS